MERWHYSLFFNQSTSISVKIRIYVKYTTRILIVHLSKNHGVLTYFQAYVYIPANDTARHKCILLLPKPWLEFFELFF